MISISQLVRRFVAIICVCSGLGFTQVASAQCSVDADTAAAIDKLQRARDNFTVSGTFLRESAVRRDFVEVIKSEEASTGTVQFVNSKATNAEQTFHLPLGRYMDPCEVSKLYAVTLAGGAKVAGNITQVLQFRPRDTLRLGHVLALEKDSGVLLRSDTLSENGELLERHEFATVTISPVATDGASDQSQADSPLYLNIPGLPRGYRASLARGYEGRALFVSDGVAAATVIFEPLPNNVKPGEGAVRRGATLTYTRGSFVAGKKILVTVIGEIPLAAARVIADAVKLTTGQR